MDPVPSITSAGRSRDQDVSDRAMRYTIMMAIRVACFFAAVFTEGWLRWTFAAGAIVLPYIAVVLANAGRRKTTGGAPDNLIDTGAIAAAPYVFNDERDERDDPDPRRQHDRDER